MKYLTCITTLLLMVMLPAGLRAQDQVEYKMEIGVLATTFQYTGDLNGNVLAGMRPGAGVLLRRDFNPYMTLALQGVYGKVAGNNKKKKLHDLSDAYSFDTSVGDLSLMYEYHFDPYGTGREYRGAKRLTPFITAGLGVTFARNGNTNIWAANIPMGVGVKYKIGDRTNLALQWDTHLTTTDCLDGLVDPKHIQTAGWFKNKDCYSNLKLSLTYSFQPKCKTCNKE